MQIYCEKCGQTMNENQFYTSKNLERYPNNGKLNICKQCLTMHVDNWNPETYLPILEDIDVPYIKEEWDKILEKHLEKHGNDPTKMTGLTILGRYLSKMKLRQWADYRWADTERIQEELKMKKTQSMKASGYTEEEIEQHLAVDHTPARPSLMGSSSPEEFVPEPDEFMDQLTEEDKTYLKLKWGKTYRAEEWIKLEQLYEDMLASYDVQGAGHKDTLKMVCKASLKANQLIDIGD